MNFQILTQQEMKRFYQDFNQFVQISLTFLALGDIRNVSKKEELFLSDFYDFWTAFKQYEEFQTK